MAFSAKCISICRFSLNVHTVSRALCVRLTDSTHLFFSGLVSVARFSVYRRMDFRNL